MRFSIGSPKGDPPRAFTLVELLTVIAIIAILMSLIVGAFTGFKGRVARENTGLMFRALESALQAYYRDWGAYPYFEEVVIKVKVPDPSNPGSTKDKDERVMDQVSDTLIPPGGSKDLEAMGILYAALNARMRNGPYMPGSSSQTVEIMVSTGGRAYPVMVYADGWGRPIMYGPPLQNPNPADGSRPTLPRLESRGGDEFDKGDNLKNYNYDQSLEELNWYRRN
ncbi:MAG: type II secretion system protein [Planctomycetota bacterium]|nr:type II secretion system protein [Planctomycetota bacterium]